MSNEKPEGLTLIELTIVVGLVSVIAVISFLALSGFRGAQTVKLTMDEVGIVLNDTRNKSITQEDGESWGVRFINSTTTTHGYEVFKGASYDVGTTTASRILKSGLEFGNPSEGNVIDVIFDRVTGRVPNNKTITITAKGRPGMAGNVAVNKLGRITTWFEEGLVGYWPMDEAISTIAYDGSGFGNEGMLTNGPTWQSASNCKAGPCLSFTTSVSNQHVDIVDNAGSLKPQTTLTLVAWIYPTGVGGTDPRGTVVWGNTPTSYYLSYNDSNKALDCYWYGTSPPGYHSTPNDSVPLSEWSHIVCVWDGLIISQYIDGQLLATTTVTGLGTQPTKVNIGAESTGRQFEGRIDDIRVYNRTLSAEEIRNLYEATR